MLNESDWNLPKEFSITPDVARELKIFHQKPFFLESPNILGQKEPTYLSFPDLYGKVQKVFSEVLLCLISFSGC